MTHPLWIWIVAAVAVILASVAPPVAAQDRVTLGYGDPPDRAWIDAIAADAASVGYYNSAAMASADKTTATLAVGRIVVDVTVETSAGPHGADALHLSPRGGYIAVPQSIIVKDGETGTAIVSLPMY